MHTDPQFPQFPFLKEDFWPHDTTLWIKDFKGNDPRFLSYFLPPLKLENFDVGAASPTLNRNHIHGTKVFFPRERRHQERIAAVLSAYDERMENNRRRIALMEKLAEEIYREWFVCLHFPGHEKVKLVKGRPPTWSPKNFGDIAAFTMGQSPPSSAYNETRDGRPFHQGVGTHGARFLLKQTYCNVEGRKARQRNILFSVRAPVGRLNMADCEMIIGRGLAAIRHRRGYNSYLYYLLKVALANEDIIGNGSIFNSVGKDELAKFQILHPGDDLVGQFDSLAAPIDQQIAILIKSVDQLIRTRDLLLRRLISGKLSVEHLDIQFSPGMVATSNPS